MRAVVRIGSVVLIVAAVAAVVSGWLPGAPDLERADAVDVAVGALADVGVDGAVPDGQEPEAITHEPSIGEPVEAWAVPVEVDGEVIELRVQRDVGQIIYVDDVIGPDRQQRLLTDAQYEGLGAYRNDEVLDDWVRANAAGTGAAALVVVVAGLLFRRNRGLGDDATSSEPTTPTVDTSGDSA